MKPRVERGLDRLLVLATFQRLDKLPQSCVKDGPARDALARVAGWGRCVSAIRVGGWWTGGRTLRGALTATSDFDLPSE